MKVLLIDPPDKTFTGYARGYFPLGLTYVAAALRAGGHEAAVFHADALTFKQRTNIDNGDEYRQLQSYLDEINSDRHPVWGEIKSVLKDFAPDLVGITAMTMQFGSVVRTAQICKDYDFDLPVVVGGPHATDWPQMALSTPHIDFNLGGEAEDSVQKLAAALERGDTKAFAEIPGLAYRDGGEVRRNPVGLPPKDLDSIPMPARDLLMHADNYDSEAMGIVMTSRGCPFNCSFCSHERLVRYRNLDNVIAEIRSVKETYGTTQFAFKDDTFTTRRKRVVELCKRLIDERIDINWDCTTRANLLDDELLDLMMAAGCNIVKVGVETGSQRILEEVDKGVSFDEMRQAAELFNRKGIFWSAFFMYGLPNESADDMRATYKFMKELNPFYAGLGMYSPMPNTGLWDLGVEMGLVDPDVGVDHFFTTNPKSYFFKDPSHRVATMTTEEFEEMADYMMDKFNHHNTRLNALARRGWARRKTYAADWKMLVHDCRKALSLIKTLIKNELPLPLDRVFGSSPFTGKPAPSRDSTECDT